MKQRLYYYYTKHALQWRFLMVGAFNTLVGIILYPLLYLAIMPLRHHYNVLLVITQIICITISYFTNKAFVFKTQGHSFLEYVRFTLFYNIIFIVNLIALPAFVKMTDANPAKIQVVISVFVAVSSYFWHSLITFRKNKF